MKKIWNNTKIGTFITFGTVVTLLLSSFGGLVGAFGVEPTNGKTIVIDSSQVLKPIEKQISPDDSLQINRKTIVTDSLRELKPTEEQTPPDDSLQYTYAFPLPTLTSDELGTIITIQNLTLMGNSGAPCLPVKTVELLLPQGKTVNNIEVSAGDGIQLPGTYEVAPGQPVYPLSFAGKITVAEPDPVIYNSSDPYPGYFSKTVTTQDFCGYTILTMNFYPVQYVPQKGELTFYPAITVALHLIQKNKDTSPSLICRNLPGDIVRVRNLVENPEVLATYTPEAGRRADLGGKGGLVNPADTYAYVIITNEALRDSTGEYTFQDLLQSKLAKGVSATLVTVEDITACSDYWWDGLYGDGRPDLNDTACQIRNFIKDAYENWETRYVLLGGDGDGANVGGESGDNIIPARELYAPVYPVLDPEGGDLIAADLYYACLEGSFDSNNNNIFGEIGDGYDIHSDGEVDLFAEVYVGRAPVDNATELSNFVRKTSAYENTDAPYLENVRMVGELLWDMILGLELKVFASPAKDEIKDGTSSTVGIPQEKYNVSTLYDDEGMMKQETVDLTPYAGVSDHVRIGFRLKSDEYLNYSGLYIDDVNVTGDDGTQIFFDDMEYGVNGWTHSGAGDEWDLGIPFTGALQAHSGINCWGTDLDGTYENLCDQRLVSPPIDLSSVSTAKMSFYRWSYTEENCDYGYVEISTDNGQSWTLLKTYTGGWTKTDISQIINDGVHIINHLGHSNVDYCMRLSNSDADTRLTNDRFFFGYSQGCYGGSFDNREPGPPLFQNPRYLPYDCIGEHLVTSVHGAFACVLNSRYGLGAVNPRQGPSQYFDRQFFDALYGENKRNLGVANQDSKEDNIGLLGMDGIRYCYYELNLFGDPEIAIKDPVPREHDIAVTTLNATAYMKVNTLNHINATIHNSGQNLEIDVPVQFYVNGQQVDEQVIPSLAVGQSVIVEFGWTPHAEGDYIVGVLVPPLDGETMLYNNQMNRIVRVCSNDAVYVCVLDSYATGLGHGICDTLNQEWETYGSVPVVIDYTTFGENSVTYAGLVEAHPDVLLVSMIMPQLGGHEFSHGEIAAITKYVKEGHGFTAINNPFYYGTGEYGIIDNRELLPLFGLRDDLEVYPLGGQAGNLALLVPDHPLFRNVPNPYSVGEPDCSVPHGCWSSWDAADLNGGTFVAQSSNSQGVIVVNDNCVYISNGIDLEQNANDLQFVYNAIVWSCYTTPPVAPTGLTAVPGDIFVNLYWSQNSEEDIDHYTIYRSMNSDTGFEKIAQVDSTAMFYQDTERFMGTTYYYKITATNKGYRESDFSSIVSASPHRPVRGDVNNDGVVNAGDVVYLINYLFVHGPAPFFLVTGDVNNDGTFEEPRVNIADVVYLINYLFINGPPPVYLDWPNHPPRANAGDDQIGEVGYPVSFNGSNSYDLDGSIVSYLWDFGDTSPPGFGITTTHMYANEGTFTVTLTVIDDKGDADYDTAVVTIGEALAADAHGPYTGSVCDPVHFIGTATGGCLNYTWHWDFGDGDTSNQQNPDHVYSTPGEYVATLNVTDSLGSKDNDTAFVTIKVMDANAHGPYFGSINKQVQFIGSVCGGTPSYSWLWTFGDDDTSTLQNPLHTYDTAGEYTVTLTVTDGNGANDSETTLACIGSNLMVAENTSGVAGDNDVIICISGTWYDTLVAYALGMYFDETKIEIIGVILQGTVVDFPGQGDWRIMTWGATSGYLQALAIFDFSHPVYLPPDSGTLFKVVVSIKEDASNGPTALDLAAQGCYFINKSTFSIYPDLVDGVLTISGGNNPPTAPGNPNPANHATDVSVNAVFSWTASGDPDPGDTVTYDVYFETTTPPTTKVSSNQSVTTYDPGTMNYDTKYYWQIIAWDNHNASNSSLIWDFTTASPVTCTLEQPVQHQKSVPTRATPRMIREH